VLWPSSARGRTLTFVSLEGSPDLDAAHINDV
jgi:hypothetical protein